MALCGRIFEQWLHSTNDERFVNIEMGAYDFDMRSRAARDINAAYATCGRPSMRWRNSILPYPGFIGMGTPAISP